MDERDSGKIPQGPAGYVDHPGHYVDHPGRVGGARTGPPRLSMADVDDQAPRGGSLPQTNASAAYMPDPRQMIEDRIEYHNRMANGLHALLRSMPQEMSYEARNAFAQLLLEANRR